MTPKDQIRTWTREVGNTIFTCSTDPSLVDLAALNAALSSDTVWWGKHMTEEALKRMVENSYNICLYVTEKGDDEKGKRLPFWKYTRIHKHRELDEQHLLTKTTTFQENDKPQQQNMIGSGRLVTDYVTFGYLTDVYVLPDYQGKGLGAWMMECLNEAVEQWPDLRRVMLLTGDEYAAKMYERTLGAKDMREGKMMVLERTGPGAVKKMYD